MHRFHTDILNDVVEDMLSDKPLFLKHPDDKGDHILVNDDFDIVGVIDWERCQMSSKEDAFSSPCMIWPVTKFYDGSKELAEEELQLSAIFRERVRDVLAKYVVEGRKMQRPQASLRLWTGNMERVENQSAG
ncbi:hypothetical protein F4774DRAFT_406805 [Daldinia eschscholtzii]|nr:hypothetical protein F4774DRAFT_406805 [Daldinia eschscholtzii]